MNFTTFSVANTNIFPHANSKYGGQLMSEFNLRCREMVAVNPAIKFESGPSFVHCRDDFALSSSGSKLIIAPGRGVINGHYIETLTPMEVDLLEANIIAKRNQRDALKGTLEVGFKVFYSTEPTMAGTLLVTRSSGASASDSGDDTVEEVYLGVQTVILPKGQLRLPGESRVDTADDVTAHIRLGQFTYANGAVELAERANEKIYEDKQRYIPASRIANSDEMLKDDVVKSDGLQPNQFYVFSGNSKNWCDATDSLIMWGDSETARRRNGVNVAPKVVELSDGRLALRLYKKPIDSQTSAEAIHIVFPSANYSAGTAGVIDRAYSDVIRNIHKEVSQFYRLSSGQGIQRSYIDSLTNRDEQLLTIQPDWKPGDYVLVNQDMTLEEVNASSKASSTLYVVLPGTVSELGYFPDVVSKSYDTYFIDKDGHIIQPTQDNKYAYLEVEVEQFDEKSQSTVLKKEKTTEPPSITPSASDGRELGLPIRTEIRLASDEADEFPTDKAEIQKVFDVSTDNTLRGSVSHPQDYCVGIYQSVSKEDEDGNRLTINIDGKDIEVTKVDRTYTYYLVTKSGPLKYSEPLLLSRQIPLAEEEVIGGFLNVSPEDALDGGYVYRDDNGHLRLLDYALLRTGVLAYQLGEDFSTDSSATADSIQETLDEYVNQRVAFPNANAANTGVITIDLNLTREDEPTVLNIYDIDSRFNTPVLININGDADENTTINIVNCEKVRIGNNISGTPVINVQKCNLYYDSVVIDYIRGNRGNSSDFSGFSDIKLWYERFEDEDPNLVVDGMTVMELDAPVSSNIIDYWSTDTPNDNHYAYALKSITFNDKLEIIRCEMLVSNDSTNNKIKEEGHSLIEYQFELPQGQGLTYPLSSLTKPLKVTGTFVSAYVPEGVSTWVVTDTNFSAVSGTFNEFEGTVSQGTILFHASTHVVTSSITNAGGWEPGKYHMFTGGIIS